MSWIRDKLVPYCALEFPNCDIDIQLRHRLGLLGLYSIFKNLLKHYHKQNRCLEVSPWCHNQRALLFTEFNAQHCRSLQHCSWRQFHFICWHCSSASTLQHCSTAATRGSGTQRVTRLLHITRTAALQHVGSCSRLLQCCSELQLQCDTLDTSCPAAAAWSPHMCCSAAVLQSPSRPLIPRWWPSWHLGEALQDNS